MNPEDLANEILNEYKMKLKEIEKLEKEKENLLQPIIKKIEEIDEKIKTIKTELKSNEIELVDIFSESKNNDVIGQHNNMNIIMEVKEEYKAKSSKHIKEYLKKHPEKSNLFSYNLALLKTEYKKFVDGCKDEGSLDELNKFVNIKIDKKLKLKKVEEVDIK